MAECSLCGKFPSPTQVQACTQLGCPSKAGTVFDSFANLPPADAPSDQEVRYGSNGMLYRDPWEA